MNNDYLQHYGVKGMKWGVRHDRERKFYSAKKISVISPKDQKKYKKMKGYEAYSNYLRSYNNPNTNSIIRAKSSAKSAKYRRKAEKLKKQLGNRKVSAIEREIKERDSKAKYERAKSLANEMGSQYTVIKVRGEYVIANKDPNKRKLYKDYESV